MDRLEHLEQLKARFKQLRLTTPKPEKVNKLPRGCADYRYSRSFQVQSRRALLAKGGAA
ncbi:hypothetical protein [Photobacterium sp. TY1-4]|uniref:hypothetical protein n=1 Tax=Photobacterium sp. TY1-4 TaxID=2899122 RepID=UPI0021C1A2A7|nr:hypothetical protein [Photobacterium sp. TY1-4]UXI02762.1 hypothetical protein NH461_08380 [Photobacterium sp. TY1-4]